MTQPADSRLPLPPTSGHRPIVARTTQETDRIPLNPLDEASAQVKQRLGAEFVAQKSWLTQHDVHQSLERARTALRAFRTHTGLPVDRIQAIGTHWGNHPMMVWASAGHFALMAAWLLEGGSLPGEWRRSPVRSSPPNGPQPGVQPQEPSTVPLTRAGEQELCRWWIEWSLDKPLQRTVVGRALAAWIRRGAAPGPRPEGWAGTLDKPRECPIERDDPAPVTLRAAQTIHRRGARVIPMLAAMQSQGWDFTQPERLAQPVGQPGRVVSARGQLQDDSPFLPHRARNAWRAWWQQQDRRILEAALESVTSQAPAPRPAAPRSRL